MSNLIDIYATKLMFNNPEPYIENIKHLDKSIIDLLDRKELVVFGTDLKQFLRIKNPRLVNGVKYVFPTPPCDLFLYFLMADYE